MSGDAYSLLKSVSVLYVEDDDLAREQMEQFMRRRVGALYVARNGQEGLEQWHRHRPDIVVTDIMMPVLDGLSMAARIRDEHAGVPIVVTTAYNEAHYFLRAIDIGVDKYVVKPVNGDLLEHALLKCAREVRAEAERLEHERKLLEAKLAAESANVAKSRFLATMSHEIRTPLNGVLGMAQLLLMPGLEEEERKEYAHTIISSGQTLLALLNDILDLSKVDAGKLELSSSAFEPRALVEETASLFAEGASGKGLKLEARWEGGEKDRYRGDPIRMRQMLSNYLSNAIKFTERGTVEIVARPEGEDVLRFEVKDTGIGIGAADREKLFLPFSQVDSSDSRRFGGTGLGLSIVASLARLMAGDVGVESVAGQGSTFWFRVRAQRLAPGSEARASARGADCHGEKPPACCDIPGCLRTILVAEDNEVNGRVIATALRKGGYCCVVVENGEAALGAATLGVVDAASGLRRPDLLLMDCQMPVMNGFEATRRIRAWEDEQGAKRLPIVALTAGAFQEDRERCLAAGMDDFLAKPLDMPKLYAALGAWLTAVDECEVLSSAESAKT